MRRLRALIHRVAGVFRTTRRDAELAAEIESHLQLHTDENIRRGMSPEAAHRDAVLQLGSVVALTEGTRDRRGLPVLEHLVQDLRYAGRTMRRSAAVTLVAAVTLALGVAGPTVMFAMMKAWILGSPAFPAAGHARRRPHARHDHRSGASAQRGRLHGHDAERTFVRGSRRVSCRGVQVYRGWTRGPGARSEGHARFLPTARRTVGARSGARTRRPRAGGRSRRGD